MVADSNRDPGVHDCERDEETGPADGRHPAGHREGDPVLPGGEFGRRRTFLRMAGAGALASGLAGCSTTQTRRYEAKPVALEQASGDPGYVLSGSDTVETSRSPEAGGVTLDVTLVSQAASYDQTGSGFLGGSTVGLVSTPSAKEAGVALNPVMKASLRDLLTGSVGAQFLRQVGVGAGWTRGPDAVTKGKATLLGSPVEFQTFAGVTDDGEFALVDVARTEYEGDVVLVGDSRTKAAGDPETPLVGPDGHVTGATVDEVGAAFAALLELVVHGTAPDGDPATADGKLPPGRIPIGEVPEEIRRRGARFVERQRSEDPRTWSEAGLGEYAHPVSRPDVDGTAYYELEVEPEGYVLLATGRHDAPIPNFATEGRSIGRSLEEQAEGTFGGLVWIDRLRFVAEDPDGNVVAARGNDVPRIRGLEALLDRKGDPGGHVRTGPEEGSRPAKSDDGVDEGYEPSVLVRENDREPPAEFAFERWSSHDQLKEHYADAYGPLLADLRERAGEAWAVLEEREAVAGSVVPGGAVREPLVGTQAVLEVTGADQATLDVGRVTRELGADLVEIRAATDASVGAVATLVLGDDEGQTEELEVTVVESAADAAEEAAPAIYPTSDTMGDAGALATRHWAGGAKLHTWYWQHDFNGCPVGCGPVAWALLFGWADRQADSGRFNSTWWRRWGLYRSNGGRGSNAVAPKRMYRNGSQGVKNMLEEINHHVDVFCMGDNGATAPWDMNEVKYYLSGRTGTSIEYWYSPSGVPWGKCKNEAIESIKGNASGKGPTPVVVGKGWLSHYPMAYAWSNGWWDYFKVNNGWGKSHDQATEWIWEPTWFSGEIYP
jgi:hypothetical protein